MPKSKEILFRTKNGGRTYEAQRGNLIFELVDVRGVDDVDSTYIVKVRHKVIDTLGFTTCGHRDFPLEEAKAFCQGIADGEIDPEALLMEFAAENAARKRPRSRKPRRGQRRSGPGLTKPGRPSAGLSANWRRWGIP